MRSLVALVVAATLVPAGLARGDEWEEDYSGGAWADNQPYDVSVDLNVSGGVNVETFQAPLAPYGEWVVAGGYGRVWRPRVAVGWRPYYYGRWEWTNEGWLWVSDEPYGWAVYHYGRWAHDPYYGWVWVPGSEWAPAWVSWRYSGDAIGWAPLSPGLSLYVTTYPFVDFCWTFVPTARFVSVPVYQAAYAPGYTRQWFYRTAPAPARPAPAPGVRAAPAPTPAWGGPAPHLVAERIGRPLTPVRVVPAPSPGAGVRARPGEVAIYRPGPAPAHGRGPAAQSPAPRADGGRGPAAPAPAWRGQGQPAPAWQRGGAAAAPPAWRPEQRGNAPPPPAARPAPQQSAGPAWRPEARPAPQHGAAPQVWHPDSRPAPQAWHPESRPAPAPQARPEGHGGGRGGNEHERPAPPPRR